VKHRVLWIVLALAWYGTALSAETPQEVLEKVKRRYDAINDAELKFAQVTKYEVSKLEQRVTGTLFIKKQNKYRVEYSDRIVVTDGKTVWSYNPHQRQVLIDHFKVDPNVVTPEKILAAAPKEYYASIVGTENIGSATTRVLKLLPKDSHAFVRTMKLWVDETTWLIKKVELTDDDGKQTIYTVADIKVNTGIPDSHFTYTIPEGVEAIDLR